MKLFIVNTHPIEYHVNLYRKLSEKLNNNLKILFLWDRYESYLNERKPDQSFIENNYLPFDLRKNLLNGYNYEFIKNLKKNARYGYFDYVSLDLFKKVYIERPKFVLCYGYNHLIFFLLLLFCKIIKIKFILKGEVTKKSMEKENFMKKFYKIFFFNLCDFISFSCKKNKEFFYEYTSKKSKFINFPCAVNNNYLQNLQRKMKREKNFNSVLPKEKFNFIYAGKIIERKNIGFMIRNFINQFSENDYYTLNLIGNGIEEERLKIDYKQYKGQINFIDHMDYEDLYKNLYTAKVLIITSHYDPSPKIINECLNFEIPIICSDSVGTSGDLVINNFNGYIFKNNDDNDFKKALKNIIIDKNLNNLKKNCHASLKKWDDLISVNELMNIVK